LNNGLGLSPAMGWSSWNALGASAAFNETTLRQIATIQAAQYLPAGYKYFAIDDGWAYERLPNCTITVDPVRFPSGMPALVSFVQSLGLLFGIYTDRGNRTCLGRPGSYGFEACDAAQYAAWGVSYVKNDDCNSPVTGLPSGPTSEDLNARMRDAINATG